MTKIRQVSTEHFPLASVESAAHFAKTAIGPSDETAILRLDQTRGTLNHDERKLFEIASLTGRALASSEGLDPSLDIRHVAVRFANSTEKLGFWGKAESGYAITAGAISPVVGIVRAISGDEREPFVNPGDIGFIPHEFPDLTAKQSPAIVVVSYAVQPL